jgi:hypothetical protein
MRKLGPGQFGAALDVEIARVETSRGEVLRRETREYVAGYRLPAPRRPAAAVPSANGSSGFAAWRSTNARPPATGYSDRRRW